MTNRPKQIGTAAETAVVRVSRKLGFPQADRLALTGSLDRGDVGLAPGVVVEVKGGEAARKASDATIDGWLEETSREREHAGAEVAFLVVQRKGAGAVNAHRWWAYWRIGWLEITRPEVDRIVVRMTLEDALIIVRAAGYGEPLDPPLLAC